MTTDGEVLELGSEPPAPQPRPTWDYRHTWAAVGVLLLIMSVVVAVFVWPRTRPEAEVVGLHTAPTEAWQRDVAWSWAVPVGDDALGLILDGVGAVVDAETGETRWSVPLDGVPGHTALRDLPGTPYVSKFDSTEIVLLDRGSGETRHTLTVPGHDADEVYNLYSTDEGSLVLVRARTAGFAAELSVSLLRSPDLSDVAWTTVLQGELWLPYGTIRELNGVLYLPSMLHAPQYSNALQVSDGRPVPWTDGASAIVVSQGVVVVALPSSTEARNPATGEVLWEGPASHEGLIFEDGGLFVVPHQRPDLLLRLDPAPGREVWRANDVFAQPQTFKTVDGHVFVGGVDREIAVLRMGDGVEVARYEAANPPTWMFSGEGQVVVTAQAPVEEFIVTVEAFSTTGDGASWTYQVPAGRWPDVVGQRLVLYSDRTITVMR